MYRAYGVFMLSSLFAVFNIKINDETIKTLLENMQGKYNNMGSK